LSLQALEFAFVKTHPVAGAQVSLVQGLLSLQTTAGPPAQAPAPLHLSFEVQALPSSHATVLFVWMQPPCGVQESSVQGLLSLQLTVVPVHAPAAHLSDPVQALLSLQALPVSGCATHLLCASTHAPVLH